MTVVSCLATTARAQDDADIGPETSSLDDVADDGAAAGGATDDAGGDAGIAPADAAAASRFRWGITGGVGPMYGGYTGVGFGVDARFGMQLDQMLAVYAQPSAFVFVGAAADDDSAEATAGAVYGLGVLGDVTLGDLFFLAAGPELLSGAIGSTSTTVNMDGTTASASGAEGLFFSVAARTGFVFGSKRPDRRSGFSVGLDMHAVFANGEVAMPVMIFLGYERF